jgi:hypothetical protein
MNKTRLILNIAIAAVVFFMWIRMFLSEGGVLAGSGFSSMKYFTVLSNQLEGIACVVWLASVRKGGGKASAGAETFKYVACVAVMVTFCVVALFLGPIYGYGFLYQGSNLWFHLIIPLAALFEALFLAGQRYTKRDNCLSMLPALCYGTFYLINIAVNGKGEWPDTNDWYGFLNWGWGFGFLIFAGIAFTSWMLGLILREAARIKK